MKKIKILFATIVILLTDMKLAGSFLKNIFLILLLYVRFFFRRNKLKVIALTEHLGDIVASEPVARYLRNKFPGAYICWVTDKKYAEIIDSNPYINRAIKVSCLTEWVLLKHLLKNKSIYDLHINNSVCQRHFFVNVKDNPYHITLENYYEKGNLLFAFSRSAGIEVSEDSAPQLYFKKASPSIMAKYIVIHTSSNHASRMWDPDCWNNLAQFIFDKFNEYLIIEIGFEKEIQQKDERLIDMTGKKNLQLIAGLIQNSSLFIGIDSSFAHFANALNKESIILIGTLGEFKKYMPYSGKFQKERDQTIIYHPGLLKTMPCNNVFHLVSKKLSLQSQCL